MGRLMPAQKPIDSASVRRLCPGLPGSRTTALERRRRVPLSSDLLRLFSSSRPTLWNDTRSRSDLQTDSVVYEQRADGNRRSGSGMIVSKTGRQGELHRLCSNFDFRSALWFDRMGL
jgi:hypothetical protein